jgi:hypothetical protein
VEITLYINSNGHKKERKMKNIKGYIDGGFYIWLGLSTILVIIGHTGYKAGKFGKDGSMAVKNCVGTHVNDNCNHLPLNKAQLQTSNNFAK